MKSAPPWLPPGSLRVGFFLLAWAGVWLVLLLRNPDLVRNPQLTWENGSFFFTEAMNEPLRQNLFKTWEGYYLPVPFLVAEATARVNYLPEVPLITAILCLLIDSLCLCVPLAPWFAGLMSFPLRLGLVVASPLLPWQTETLGDVANLHWYLFYALAWISLADGSRIGRWTAVWLLPVTVACLSSTANAILLLPVFFLRLFVAKVREPRTRIGLWILTGAVIINASVLLLTYSGQNFVNGRPFAAGLFDTAHFIVKTVGFKVVLSTLFGSERSFTYLQGMGPYVAAFLGLSLAWVFALWLNVRAPLERRAPWWFLVAVGYYVIAPVGIVGFGRPGYVRHFVTDGQNLGADRYFLVPSYFLLVLLLWLLARLAAITPRWVGPAIFVGFFGWYGMTLLDDNFAYPKAPKSEWKAQIRNYYGVLLSYEGEPRRKAYRFPIPPGHTVSLPLARLEPAERESILLALKRAGRP